MVDFIQVHHVCFKCVYHPACGPRCAWHYECASTSFGVDINFSFARAVDQSLSVRFQIAQLGAGFKPNLVVVSTSIRNNNKTIAIE